jgi:small GTP-binding protein
MDIEGCDYQYSVLLVGDTNVGKTSLLTKYVHDKFTTAFNPTIGIDFKIKTLKINDKKMKLRIWDTAGQEKFRTITNSYYRGAHGVVVCFAVDNRDSFHATKNWLTQINQLANKTVTIIIIGCKCDVHPREVSSEEGERLAAENNSSYYEVSSKTGTNIETIFSDLLERMHSVATKQSNKVPDANKDETVERNKFLQSAYEVQISGAQSWYNKNKINGRYVPQITKDGQILLELGRFCYWNIDSANTVMVYADSHWVIKRNKKELAKIASSSIQCFPDTASLRSDWCENYGVYFTWWHHAPTIKCVVLNSSGASSRISVADIFVSPEQRGTINMPMFLHYSKEPEQMGLTIPLFVQCCQIRIAILDLEYRSLKRSYDYVTMAEVRIQRQQIDQTCKSLMATMRLPEKPPIHVNKDNIIAVLSAFLEEIEDHYEQLCNLETGNFDAARRCRETQQDLLASLEKLTNFVPGPDAARLSLMALERIDLQDLSPPPAPPADDRPAAAVAPGERVESGGEENAADGGEQAAVLVATPAEGDTDGGAQGQAS